MITDNLTLPTHFFVYGTLKVGGSNARLFRDSAVISTNALTVDNCFRMTTSGFPYVFFGGDSKVKGNIYKVTDPEVVKSLDRLEGYPNHFDRAYIPVVCGVDGFRVNAWMYYNPVTEYYDQPYLSKVSPKNGVVEWLR